MYLGRDLDAFVHSARVVYNYLCAIERPDHGPERDELVEKYTTAMQSWCADPARNSISCERLSELDQWAQQALSAAHATAPARSRWKLTYTFLVDWQRIATSSSNLLRDVDAARVIRRRERWLKQARARLGNPELLRGWPGDSGYFHLDYNWSVATMICGDIHDGLGTRFTQAPEAA
jgi:hypothetical protein